MSEHGVRVQRFFVASTAKEALEAAKRLSKLVQGMSVGHQWKHGTGLPLLCLCSGLHYLGGNSELQKQKNT